VVTTRGQRTYHRFWKCEGCKQLTLTSAANATSHLFFAYLRALAPEQTTTVSGISKLPRSLQALLSQTEYPPEPPSLMQSTTTKVVMIVQDVSPTPFALLRRARNFEYREDDHALQEFSDYDDPVRALTEECRRVLTCISTTNQSAIPSDGNTVQDPSWSRFEDMGFSSLSDGVQSPGDLAKAKNGMRSSPGNFGGDFARPATPSWADFLSSGFAEERSPTLLPPDKQLPLPVPGPRAHSSQSHRPLGEQANLEPGELASISTFDLDETFWWVWMTSLAAEEPAERKSVFGRCALIETHIYGAAWLLIEEQVKGASPGQDEGVYLAEKKSRFSFTRRGRLGRKKTTKKSKALEDTKEQQSTMSLNRISPEKHEQIQAAAKRLARGDNPGTESAVQRRSRLADDAAAKTTSTMSVGNFMNEAGAALKWTNHYDSGAFKDDIRHQYLSDPSAGTGKPAPYSRSTSAVNLSPANGLSPSTVSMLSPNGEYSSAKRNLSNRDLPAVPNESSEPAALERAISKSPVPPSPPRTPPHIQASKASHNTQFFADEKIAPTEEHPALRNDSVESPIAPVASHPSPEIRKVSPKQEHKKLQKKEPAGANGLKKLFGRKKPSDRADTPTEHFAEKVEEQPKPKPKVQEQPKPKVVEQPKPKVVEQPKPKAPVSKPIIVPEYARTPEPTRIPDSPPRSAYNEPTFNAPSMDNGHSSSDRDDARRAALDRLEAEDEFSRFDQGPMDEMPAFAPADDEDEDDDAAAPPPVIKPHASNNRTAGGLHPGRERPADRSISPARKPIAPQMRFPVKSADAPAGQPAINTSDRWAQIRKNAAERAARMNEEQQRAQTQQHGRNHSASARSDDGETSGEETIESRVARIKARVAELTGEQF
jgi:hypothetical protein